MEGNDKNSIKGLRPHRARGAAAIQVPTAAQDRRILLVIAENGDAAKSWRKQSRHSNSTISKINIK